MKSTQTISRESCLASRRSPRTGRVCPCCRGASAGGTGDDDVDFCSTCIDRSHEKPGRDYDAAELGGEA